MRATLLQRRASVFVPERDVLEVPHSPLIQEINVSEHMAHLPDDHFLVYSGSALRQLGFADDAFRGHSIRAHDVSIALCELQQLAIPSSCSEITVFGAGRAIDIGKYLAHEHGMRLTIIPSVLSTNAFGTPFGCYDRTMVDSSKTTLRTGFADAILVDFDFLSAPQVQNHLGLSDVLSITTALHDWDLAMEQDASLRSPSLYRLARSLADAAFAHIGTPPLDTRTSFTLVLNSAYLTALYGNGRPESGSEHVFSKVMEREAARAGAPLMHGTSVALGILLMATLQRNTRTDALFSAVRTLRLLHAYARRTDELKRTAAAILPKLEPHPTRHTIVNEQLANLHSRSFADDLADAVVDKLYSDA